jgi:hypothetical protein
MLEGLEVGLGRGDEGMKLGFEGCKGVQEEITLWRLRNSSYAYSYAIALTEMSGNSMGLILEARRHTF